MKQKVVLVSNKLQKRYRYVLTEPAGKNFHSEFRPDLTPQQMLRLGVFGGHYMEKAAWKEFPASWLRGVKLSPAHKDSDYNYFKVNASQSLAEWRRKDWIYPDDPYGWFQWYCRYYMGRRIPAEDMRQIKRWNAIARHVGAVKKHCMQGDYACRPRQRQALLHWAYDSRKL